MLGCDTFS